MKANNTAATTTLHVSIIATLCAIAIGCLFLTSCSSASNQSASTASSSSTHQSSEASSTNTPEKLTDQSSGVSVVVPDGWESVAIPSDYPDMVKWVLVPKDNSVQAQMVFLTWDMYGDASEEERAGRTREDVNTRMFDEAYVLNLARGSMTDTKSETADLVTLNGVEYWQVRVDGTSSPNQTRTDEEQPFTELDYYHYENGYAYVFATSILNAPDQTVDEIAAELEDIMSSVSYE